MLQHFDERGANKRRDVMFGTQDLVEVRVHLFGDERVGEHDTVH